MRGRFSAVLVALALGTGGGACFNAPGAAVMFACDPAGEAACPDGYTCEEDGCCHRDGGDVAANAGQGHVNLGGATEPTEATQATGSSGPTETDVGSSTSTGATSSDGTGDGSSETSETSAGEATGTGESGTGGTTGQAGQEHRGTSRFLQ
jgi:hypothetical protein